MLCGSTVSDSLHCVSQGLSSYLVGTTICWLPELQCVPVQGTDEALATLVHHNPLQEIPFPQLSEVLDTCAASFLHICTLVSVAVKLLLLPLAACKGLSCDRLSSIKEIKKPVTQVYVDRCHCPPGPKMQSHSVL